jgi:hypothetical protein
MEGWAIALIVIGAIAVSLFFAWLVRALLGLIALAWAFR